MTKLNDIELLEIQGGAVSTLNSTFINAIARLINTVLDLGRVIGSNIKRIQTKNYC